MIREVDVRILRKNQIPKLTIQEVKLRVTDQRREGTVGTDHQREAGMAEVMGRREVDTVVAMDQRKVDMEEVTEPREAVMVAMVLRKEVMVVVMAAVMVAATNTDHQTEAIASSVEDQAWEEVHQRERVDTITAQEATLMHRFQPPLPPSPTQNSSKKPEKWQSRSSWQRR